MYLTQLSWKTALVALLVLCVAGVAGVAAEIPQFTATVDGTVDASYGTALAVQTTQTQFGDANNGLLAGGGGSEVDALYVARDGSNLYIMITGNIEANGNTIFGFIDNTTESGGVSGTFAGFAGGDDFDSDGIWNEDSNTSRNNGIGGTTFPVGMNIDLGFEFKMFNDIDTRLNVADFTTSTVVFDSMDLASGSAGTDPSFSVTNGGYTWAIDNSNIAGVAGGTVAANQTAAEAVTTGMEIAVPLSAIPGTIDENTVLDIFVAVNNGSGGWWSNQFAPGLATPGANLEKDADLTTLITPAEARFSPPVLPFTDDFNVDTSADYTILAEDQANPPGSEDVIVTFAYDYSAYVAQDTDGTVVPVAPNTPDSSQTGLYIRVNSIDDTNPEVVGVNVLPTLVNLPSSTNWHLSVDMFLMYNGDEAGGPGATEYALFPINNQGSTPTWKFSSASASGELALGVTGDGGDGQDYVVYHGSPSLTDATLSNDNADPGYLAADLGFVNGEDNNLQAFYLALFPNDPVLISEPGGAPGKEWVEVDITHFSGTVTWALNGSTILTHDIAASSGGVNPGGLVGLGCQDTWDSVAADGLAAVVDNFVIFDNLLIEELTTTSVGDFSLYR
jgi:hypothetical protein